MLLTTCGKVNDGQLITKISSFALHLCRFYSQKPAGNLTVLNYWLLLVFSLHLCCHVVDIDIAVGHVGPLGLQRGRGEAHVGPAGEREDAGRC